MGSVPSGGEDVENSGFKQALITAAIVVTFGFAARVGYLLFGAAAEQPPTDAAQLAAWRRRRRWLLLSELSALPCFVILALAIPEYFAWSSNLGNLFGLGLGAFGFPFVSGVAKALIERRLGVSNAAG